MENLTKLADAGTIKFLDNDHYIFQSTPLGRKIENNMNIE